MRNWNTFPQRKDAPDFTHLLAVLRREVPERPTLFEFFFNDRIYERADPGPPPRDETAVWRRIVRTFFRLGYDYATILIPGFRFTDPDAREKKETISLNEGAVLRNEEDYVRFQWPDPDRADYGILDRLSGDLSPGMKFIPYAPDGILENVIRLMGFDTLCIQILENPGFTERVFEEVGSRLLRYYETLASFDCVGAGLANDDWGFRDSTFLSTETLRRCVFPWYRKIVEVFHACGKPMILHSCGSFDSIASDISEVMRFDGRHSYEDAIKPVEQAYEDYHDRFAILGGIDVRFICEATPAEVHERSRAMLERASHRGGYALGTGNSVPEYVPDENFFALIRAALDQR